MTIDNPVEYALYALAVTNPQLFEQAERFSCTMLANDRDAARRAKALAASVPAPAAEVEA